MSFLPSFCHPLCDFSHGLVSPMERGVLTLGVLTARAAGCWLPRVTSQRRRRRRRRRRRQVRDECRDDVSLVSRRNLNQWIVRDVHAAWLSLARLHCHRTREPVIAIFRFATNSSPSSLIPTGGSAPRMYLSIAVCCIASSVTTGADDDSDLSAKIY